MYMAEGRNVCKPATLTCITYTTMSSHCTDVIVLQAVDAANTIIDDYPWRTLEKLYRKTGIITLIAQLQYLLMQ